VARKFNTMKHLADLHIHTTASDGARTPTQIVQAAADAGLGAIGITDHDTVDGLDEALKAGEKAGVLVVPGIEVSAIYGRNTEVHMLGYFLDHHHPELLEQLDVLRSGRTDRGRRMVEQLNKAGVQITFERVLELARGGAIGRPHVARAICEIGAASSLDSAFGRWLQEGTAGYVPRHKVSPSEAVRIILEAGGVACCAHVAKLNRDELLLELMREGMRAIEVRHPDHGPAGTKYYEKFAAKHDLIATGGSDAHCIEGGKRTEIGCVTVSVEVVDRLKAAAGQGLE
jgi:predicted metal-dependent phosphoesterase TrpH